MPVCSYLAIPAAGAVEALAERLGALPGCAVIPAENRDLLILLTDTAGPEEEDALRAALAKVEGIHALLLTFGEIDPDAAAAPSARAGRKGLRLPVLDPRVARPLAEVGYHPPAPAEP